MEDIGQKSGKPLCVLLEVVGPHTHRKDAIDGLSELESLVQTYGGIPIVKDIQHRISPDPATYLGAGKLAQLRKLIEKTRVDIVIFNDILKTSQLFRLEKEFWPLQKKINIWDKADLILHIFDQHARTKEAKLQIELARIQHIGPRIYGLGETYFSRQAGGIGARGIGETNIEIMQRHINQRRSKIEEELNRIEAMKRQRIKQRKSDDTATAALVGYTNAGKTTLFNQLTGKNKRIRNSLFTTLDTVTGRLDTYRNQRRIVLSDTIGFIAGLPPFLIDAFRSTLLESLNAELLLHVVDSADRRLSEKFQAVEDILQGLRGDYKQLLLFNKSDLLSENAKESYADMFTGIPHIGFYAMMKGRTPAHGRRCCS